MREDKSFSRKESEMKIFKLNEKIVELGREIKDLGEHRDELSNDNHRKLNQILNLEEDVKRESDSRKEIEEK